MTKAISNEYINLWIEQAAREKKHNPFGGTSIDYDSWLSLLHELRGLRRKNRSTP